MWMSDIDIDTRYVKLMQIDEICFLLLFLNAACLQGCFNCIYILQVNPDMIMKLENAGLSFVGKDESGRRMEVGIHFWRKHIFILFYFNKVLYH